MKYRLLVNLAAAFLSPAAWAAAPTIVCSTNQTLECSGASGVPSVVEASVQDTDGDNLLVIWALNGVAALTNVIDSASASNGVTLSFTNDFAFGTNDVSVGVTDDGTNVVMCSTTIVVADTTPPVIGKILASPNIIWPPNHKLVPVRLRVRVEDTCGSATWRIVEVRSNEAEDAQGSGNTAPDWEIRDDHRVLVRAERSGQGSGRVYRITVEATDDSGNSSFRNVRVFVPHDRLKHAWNQDEEDDLNDVGVSPDPGSNGKGKGKGKAKGKPAKKPKKNGKG
jgi:hypothetical protein